MAERSSLVRLQDEWDLELDWRGFELHPETPPGGMLLAERFPGGRAEAMRRHLKQFAAGFGVTLGDPTRIPNTRRALAIAELARDQDKLEAFRRRAMEAHWLEGKNLEEDADLRAITVAAGLDGDAALAASRDARYLDRIDAIREEAHREGVSGIPTFLFGDLHGVVGCQPYEVLADTARDAGAQPRR